MFNSVVKFESFYRIFAENVWISENTFFIRAPYKEKLVSRILNNFFFMSIVFITSHFFLMSNVSNECKKMSLLKRDKINDKLRPFQNADHFII